MKLYQLNTLRKTKDFLLSRKDIIYNCIITLTHLRVHITKGHVEHWILCSPEENEHEWDWNTHYNKYYCYTEHLFDDRYPIVVPKYNTTPFNDQDVVATKQFHITHKYLRQFRFANVRLFLFKLMRQLADNEIIPLYFTQEEIKQLFNVDDVNISGSSYFETPKTINAAYKLMLMDKQLVDRLAPHWDYLSIMAAFHYVWNRPNLEGFTNYTILKRVMALNAISLMPILALYRLIKDRFGDVHVVNDTSKREISTLSKLTSQYGGSIIVSDNSLDCHIFVGKHVPGWEHGVICRGSDGAFMGVPELISVRPQ